MDYFYSGQLRKYLEQIVRVFSGIQYQYSSDSQGNVVYRVVPAKLAVQDKQAGSIINQNSENVTSTVPQIACNIVNLARNAERRQSPDFVGKLQIHERDIDKTTGLYTGNPGKTYTVDRFMPVPYDMSIAVEIVSSNMQQKHEIIEQILTLFNPALDIQTSTNPIDWTSLTRIEFVDMVWSTRTVPQGSDAPQDIATLNFMVPIWLNPPAKLKQQRIIQEIIANIYAVPSDTDLQPFNEDNPPQFSIGEQISQQIITPGDFSVQLTGNRLQLLGPNGEYDSSNPLSWVDLVERYGKLLYPYSHITLKLDDDLESVSEDLNGIIAFDPNNDNLLIWTVDPTTVPSNTLTSINGIIDPHQTFPGNNLPTPNTGDRYLLLNAISPCLAWGPLNANIGDIIQYDGSAWSVSFEAETNTSVQYVLNNATGQQLVFKNNQWQLSYEILYSRGFWRIWI